MSDVQQQDLRKSGITPQLEWSRSQLIYRHLVDPATIPRRDHFQIILCPPPSFSRGGRSWSSKINDRQRSPPPRSSDQKICKENPFKPCSLIFRPSTLHLNSLRWGVWSHMSLWLSNLAFFCLLVSFMFFVFFTSVWIRDMSLCHQPPLVPNETVGKEQSITSLCPNPCLDRRLHQFYRPFPPLLAKGLFRKSCFWQLCATPYKQVSWAQTSFSTSLQQIWKAKRVLMLNLWKLNEKNHLRVVCKKVKTASPKATPFSFGFVWEAAMPPPPPPAPAAAPWKPAAHQSRQSSLIAQQLSNDYA